MKTKKHPHFARSWHTCHCLRANATSSTRTRADPVFSRRQNVELCPLFPTLWERTRAQALGAQRFSLRKKMKKYRLKNNLNDVKKRLGHCFTQAEALRSQC